MKLYKKKKCTLVAGISWNTKKVEIGLVKEAQVMGEIFKEKPEEERKKIQNTKNTKNTKNKKQNNKN
jgi:hypothetical protein